MKADGVLSLIKELKGSSIEVQSLGENILDFIYISLYRDYFDYEKAQLARMHEANSYGYESALRPLNNLKSNLSYFLDGDNSIVTYFCEMVKEDKKEFIDLFIEKSEPYFELIKNKYYESSDYKIVSFGFNLYVMLAAYHFCKDDFERYKAVLEDVDFLINYNSFSNGNTLLLKKKYVIDTLISSSVYAKSKCLRSELISILKDMSNGYGFKEDYHKNIEVAINSITKIQCEYEEVSNEYPDCLMLDLNSLSSTILHSVKYGETISSRYNKYLFLGNRYNFVNSEIERYIPKGTLSDEVITRVLDMDFTMFNEQSLGEDGKMDLPDNDFFIKCLTNVLDSDSFEEVNRKLVALSLATELYRDGSKEEALLKCGKLATDDFKTVNKGRVVGCDYNSINVTNKPKAVSDRMVLAYKRLYPDISGKIPYLLSSSYSEASSYNLSTVYDNFEKLVNYSQNKYEEDLREAERKREEEQARIALEQSSVEEVTNEVVAPETIEVKDKPQQKRKSFFKGWG